MFESIQVELDAIKAQQEVCFLRTVTVDACVFYKQYAFKNPGIRFKVCVLTEKLNVNKLHCSGMPVLPLRCYTFFGTPIGQTSTTRDREKEGKQGKREQWWDRNGRASCCHTRVNNNKTCPAWGSAPLRHARDSMGTPGLRRTKPWMHCAIAQLTHGNTLTCK